VKATKSAKVRFGTAKFCRIKNVRYLSWEDTFDVEYDDGLCILEPHATIRKANKISASAKFDRLEIEDCTRGGFFVRYDNGQTAEVSWSFVRELPPKRFTEMRLDMSDHLPGQSSEISASNDPEENTAFNGAELSESVLGRDWNSPEENAAWSNL
jgi:hypothetical protein